MAGSIEAQKYVPRRKPPSHSSAERGATESFLDHVNQGIAVLRSRARVPGLRLSSNRTYLGPQSASAPATLVLILAKVERDSKEDDNKRTATLVFIGPPISPAAHPSTIVEMSSLNLPGYVEKQVKSDRRNPRTAVERNGAVLLRSRDGKSVGNKPGASGFAGGTFLAPGPIC